MKEYLYKNMSDKEKKGIPSRGVKWLDEKIDDKEMILLEERGIDEKIKTKKLITGGD